MLTDAQYKKVWERQIAAEVRSLYFADLTQRYTRLKQSFTFLTFFLASSAAAVLIGKAPNWVAILLCGVIAAITAYSVGIGLDGKIATMVKLHGDWALLAIQYENLCELPDAEDATHKLEVLSRQDLEASKLGASDAPNVSKRLQRWTDLVFQNHGLVNG